MVKNLKILPTKLDFKKFYDEHKDDVFLDDCPVCRCGLRIERTPERMDLGAVYCDGITHVQRFDYQGHPKVGVVHDSNGFDEHGKEKFKVHYCPEYARKNGLVQSESSKAKTFANFDASRQPLAFEFCQQWQPEGKLILRGKNGLGKSHLAEALFHRLRKEGKQCVWYSFDDLSKLFRNMEVNTQENYENHLRAIEDYSAMIRADVVFIDDLGKTRENAAPLFVEAFHVMLGKITGAFVITTELTGKEIIEKLSSAIESRLKENMQAIWFQGEDYRARSMKTPIQGKSPSNKQAQFKDA